MADAARPPAPDGADRVALLQAPSAELLDVLASARGAEAREALAYDVGGGGLFDSAWAPETERRLEAAAGPVRDALQLFC